MSELSDTPDRIEKKILLKAPIARVWSAISDSKQFGTWFGVAFDGPFVAGQKLEGRIVPTKVDPEVAAMQKDYEGMPFDVIVDRIEPERLFSFRWHPYAAEKDHDYSKEERTLVTFELEAVEGGTLLRVTESGFDKVPLERRAKAFTMNEGGWEAQTRLVQKYVERHASK
jgi:uncharacterized protein YndB with AHSA1/START domain